MAKGSKDELQRAPDKRMKFLAGLLGVVLVFMLILFFIQWYLITKLFSFAAELMETQLIQQAPDGVNPAEIATTFDRVEQATRGMPLSYLTGKVSLRKIQAAANFASNANADGEWTAEEVNTLLRMMNAAVGFKREEN